MVELFVRAFYVVGFGYNEGESDLNPKQHRLKTIRSLILKDRITIVLEVYNNDKRRKWVDDKCLKS